MIKYFLEIQLIRKSDKSRFRQLFDGEGGLGKLFNLFGAEYEKLLEELSKGLAIEILVELKYEKVK